MTDQEWARAFVRGKIEGTGIRLGDTVDVLVKKLAQVREEAAGNFPGSGTTSGHGGSPERQQEQVAQRTESHREVSS
ncbi:MAG: hypothetical protein WAO35_12270 [Terriglobia bacterium]